MNIVHKTPDTDDRLHELENCLATGQLVAFVGSGASSGVYEDWKDLVRNIYKGCFSDCDIPWDTMTAEALIDAAEDAKIKDKSAYYTALGKAFERRPCSRNVYRYLAGADFRNYVTTNFDNLLADELVVHPENTVDNNRSIIFPYPFPMSQAFRRSKTVVHIHGYIRPGDCPSDRNPIILARSEFKEAYSGQSCLIDFLRQLFTDNPVCFLGASLREPPLENVFKQAQSIRQNLERKYERPLPPLFILLEKWPEQLGAMHSLERTDFLVGRPDKIRVKRETPTEETETQYYESIGLNVVRYPFKPDHMGLDDLLRKWSKLSDAEIHPMDWRGNR
jgi:hypothetical protein